MDILLLDVRLELVAESNFKCPGLVVRAVRARHELLVLALEGEPGFEIVLLRCGIVQGTRNNGGNAVWNAQRLIKILGDGDHIFECFPRLLWVGKNKLLDLSTRS